MAQGSAPTARIVDRIDENHLVTLRGNTHPAANAKNDRGRVSPDLPMTDLILVLSRSPEQQAAFDKFVASQYEVGSPNYHNWLAPEEVGLRYGPAASDIAAISSWLTGHGFSIDQLAKDQMSIRFSGTAAQVESTFHTQIHNLEVDGVPHIGNMSDPQIPAALVPAVVGVKALHNFFPRPLHKLGGKVTFNGKAGKYQRIASDALSGSETSAAAGASGVRSQFAINVPSTSSSSAYLVEDVVPYDFAAIYNVTPLWTAGIDGTGQTIAIAGTSKINLTDVTTFRSTFGLPAGTPPQEIVASGPDPGICTSTSTTAVCGISDLIENSLDVEWSGAVAKGAQIILVVSGSQSATDDTVYDSSSYVVQNKTAPVLNVSYGQCELLNGAVSNAAYNNLWQTAATEGISVFVAAGDEGSAVCDTSSQTSLTLAPASNGLAVSGLASSPYDTAVGGTDFNWCNPVLNSTGNETGCSTAAPYWNTTNSATTGASAQGYVPEVPWNDTCTSPTSVAYLESLASFTGFTGVKDAETACNFVATDYKLIDLNYGSDISGFVNVVGGSGGLSNCSNNTTVISSTGAETVGTCTSGYAKPSWQTAITPADNARDLPDVSFFAADGAWDSAYLICVSEAGSACVTSNSITSEPIYQEIGGTSAASPAMAGVMALINQKAGAAQGSPNSELYALAGKQSYGSCNAAGPPGSTCYFNDITTGTIAMPCVASSPNCTVLYTADTIGIQSGYSAGTGYDLATGLGSLNVANVVNGWTETSATPSFTLSGPAVTFTAGTTTTGGNLSTISVTPTNGFTGTVNLTCAVTTAPAGATNPVACSVPAIVSVTGTAPAPATLTIGNTASTTVGGYVVTVTGTSGSITQTTSVNVTVTAAVNGGTFTLAATTPAAIGQGSSGNSTVTVSSTTLYAGTVTLSCALTSSPTGAVDLPSCSAANPSVTLSSATTTVTTTFTVSTTAAVAGLVHPNVPGRGRGWAGAGGGAVLAFLLFLGIPARRRSWRSMLGVLVVMVALGSLSGCGGGGGGGSTTPPNPGTTAGVYTFTVTGTGSPSVSPIPSATFTVTVN
jgi:subtilase family serine protease